MSTIAVTMKGMAGITSALNVLELEKKYCTRFSAMPMSSPTAMATGRLRSRAAITAANAATMTSVKSPGSRPTTGAARTPTSPARPMLTAQTPMEIRSGLVADSDVIAGESTMARTRSPMSV